jgi:hypothetical protein
MGSTRVPLDTVVVNLAAGADRVPASPSDGKPARPFSGSLRPHASARATYVFRVAHGDRGNLLLSVAVTAGRPVVAFRLHAK